MTDREPNLIIFSDEGPVRPGGNMVRWIATGVVVFCAPMLCLVALAGLFAGETNLFELVLIGIVNPIVGLAAAWAMLDEGFWNGWGSRIGVAAAVALVGNLFAALAIAVGWSSGDAEIPLILSMPFVAFVGYQLVVRFASRSRLPN